MKLKLSVPFEYLLDSLSLSYWPDVGEIVSHNGLMQPDSMRELLALVKSGPQIFPTYDQILARHPISIGLVGYWHDQYAKARHELIEFLEKNIKAGTPIKFEA